MKHKFKYTRAEIEKLMLPIIEAIIKKPKS